LAWRAMFMIHSHEHLIARQCGLQVLARKT
jgi:hypothetical protein